MCTSALSEFTDTNLHISRKYNPLKSGLLKGLD